MAPAECLVGRRTHTGWCRTDLALEGRPGREESESYARRCGCGPSRGQRCNSAHLHQFLAGFSNKTRDGDQPSLVLFWLFRQSFANRIQATPGIPGPPGRQFTSAAGAARSPGQPREQRREHERHDGHQFDQDVHGGPGGIFEGIAHGIAHHRRGVNRSSLPA